jgi:hypothetical protein
LDIEDDFEEYVEINAKLYSLCFKRWGGVDWFTLTKDVLKIDNIWQDEELNLVKYEDNKEEEWPSLIERSEGMDPYFEKMYVQLKEWREEWEQQWKEGKRSYYWKRDKI